MNNHLPYFLWSNFGTVDWGCLCEIAAFIFLRAFWLWTMPGILCICTSDAKSVGLDYTVRAVRT